MKKALLILITILLAFSCASVAALAETTQDGAQSIADINAKLNDVFEIEGLSVTSITLVSGKENHMVVYGVIVNEKDGKTESTAWNHEYVITEEQYLAMYHANDSILVYEKDKLEINSDTAKIIGKAIDDSVVNLGVGDIKFNPSGFTRDIKYMGLGMLGIFVVVGVVIVLTYILNKVTSEKESK